MPTATEHARKVWVSLGAGGQATLVALCAVIVAALIGLAMKDASYGQPGRPARVAAQKMLDKAKSIVERGLEKPEDAAAADAYVKSALLLSGENEGKLRSVTGASLNVVQTSIDRYYQ